MNELSLWQKLVGAALVGTGRGEPPDIVAATDSATPLAALVAQWQQGLAAEELLLAVAGTAALQQQVGWLPRQVTVEQTAQSTIQDQRLPLPATATHFLERLLNQEHPELLPEFLQAVNRAGFRAPEEQLPHLLEQGAKVPRLRPFIYPLLGEFGRHLASLNPAWEYATVEFDNWPTLRAHWQQLELNGRRALLAYLRLHAPAIGRQLLESTWKRDADATRRDLIRSLEQGLSAEDEPFLERALDDRDVTVRRKAAELLASLPGSRLCQRMIVNGAAMLLWTPLLKTQINVRFPEVIVDSLVRDGVNRPAAAEPTPNERTRMLIQIVGAIPLTHWSETWKAKPSEIVHAVQTSKWPRTLTTALATAALRQRNVEWAIALLEQDSYSDRTARLIAILPPDHCFAEVQRRVADKEQTMAANMPLIRFLRHWPHPWDLATSRMWVDFLVGQATLESESKASPILRHQMRQLARQCVPEVAGYAAEAFASAELSDPWKQATRAFLKTISFRNEMLGTL